MKDLLIRVQVKIYLQNLFVKNLKKKFNTQNKVLINILCDNILRFIQKQIDHFHYIQYTFY